MNRDELINRYKFLISPPKGINQRILKKNDIILLDYFENIDFLELENLFPDLDFSNLWEDPNAENKFVDQIVDIALEIKSLIETNQSIPEKYKKFVLK